MHTLYAYNISYHNINRIGYGFASLSNYTR